MKKIKQIFLLSTLMLTTLFVGCNEDDTTGQSNLEVATDVKIAVTTDFASPVSIIEGDNKYAFTVTLNKPQSVDVVVKITQVGGTASADDYAVNKSVTIPAYKLSATAELKILKDDLQEATETVTFQVGDITTSNATLTPVKVTFNIQNYTEGSLVSSLSWKPTNDLKDIEGVSIDGPHAADLKLLITKLDYNDSPALNTINASKDKFESFEMLESYTDGTYLVVAEAVSFMDLGAQGNFDLDVTVKFNQAGVYNDKTFSFTKAINSAGLTSCGATGYYKMAQITKSGGTYTISEVGEAGFAFDASMFAGPYTVILDEWEDYVPVPAPIDLEYNAADGTASFRIIYDAVATPGAYIKVTFNQATGVVTEIVNNVPFKYNLASLTSYGVSGTGKVDFCTGAINLNVAWKNLRTGAAQGVFKLNLEKN
jgi:hypothetical protein